MLNPFSLPKALCAPCTHVRIPRWYVCVCMLRKTARRDPKLQSISDVCTIQPGHALWIRGEVVDKPMSVRLVKDTVSGNQSRVSVDDALLS